MENFKVVIKEEKGLSKGFSWATTYSKAHNDRNFSFSPTFVIIKAVRDVTECCAESASESGRGHVVNA
ncbi:hypothetical protein RSAG8_00387, partial [Rhizoctonia solani AG-8 WAC10335]